MPSLTLTDIQGLFEKEGDGRGPLLEFKWVVRAFPSFDGVSIPNTYCESVNLPFPQIQETTKNVAATTLFLAGLSQVQSFDMEFYEDEKARSLKYLQLWQANIQDPFTGRYYPALHYKKNIIVTLFNTSNEPILDVLLKNVWPMGIQNWNLNYGGSNRLKNNVNFACDAAFPLD